MKTQDEIIQEQIGVSVDASDLIPMDKGECKICMTAWEQEVVNKLNLLAVSNQRELLLAFSKFAMPSNYTDMALNNIVNQFIEESK